MPPPILLTVAGSDSSGGAGIQADLKTFAAHGCYGCSAITALTAQNTRGVTAIHTPPADFLAAQLEAVLSDFPPDAVKIGMLPDADCVRAVADSLRGMQAPIVVDPVMVATSGASLSSDPAVAAMRALLFPLAAVITPNLREAEVLGAMQITCEREMEACARRIGFPVLIKGGHFPGHGANDLLYIDEEALWLRAPRLDIGDIHGTGCTLSSAIACRLAQGHTLYEAVKLSKAWLTWLLKEKPDFGVPNGPMMPR
ncbi:MAG: bifunctional hydroxymethylpyrimidine kinase/phosphomethylpyrimidine kinase [Oscillospiraceae bacterium]|nr:bifunctional hydroxymethylpyrimidine kinase/phosphomethylpyrimidine kinase [Oscillospiraceae bacterium]